MRVVETHGVRIPVREDVVTPPIMAAILHNRFEAEEARLLPYVVEEGDHVLEIGAGIGFISTLLARLPKVESVTAVEANPGLIGYMEELHHLNGIDGVERLNAVLGDSDAGTATFYLRDDFWMGSLLEGPNPYRATVEVPRADFSALVAERAISLIVCDVEGAEAILFDDVDLGGVTRVYLELHDHVTGLKGIKAVFDAMSRQGFAYDPRYSSEAIVLFRRVEDNEVLRPYARAVPEIKAATA